ncbi:MAG: hypothetical protein FWD71_12355 [Oscillospiraceae bacterium]|nr:hypothetical protein [Oscillospiraceae bacterium]
MKLHIRTKVKKSLAIFMVIGVMLSLAFSHVSAAAYPTNSYVIGVNQLLKSGSETDADRTALSTHAEDYPVPLFNMGDFAAIYPGESLTADLLIANNTSSAQTAAMTVRLTNGVTDEADCKLNEIIWLKITDGSKVLYDGLVPSLSAPNPVPDANDIPLDRFAVNESRHLFFTATVLGGIDVVDTSNSDSNLSQWLDFTKEYMGQPASFQIVFTATQNVPTTTPAPPPPPPPQSESTTPGPTPEPGPGITPTGNPTTAEPTQPPVTENITDATVPLTNAPVLAEQVQPTAGESLESFTDTQPPLASPTTETSTTEATTTTPTTTIHMPKTGEADPMGFVLPGMGLVFVGSGIIVGVNGVSKKKKSKKQ